MNKILFSVLTSGNIKKLKRAVKCLESQTVDISQDILIVVNSLDKKYIKKVTSTFPRAIVTKSDGTPATGKNSVVSLWRNKFNSYTHYSLLDGDDFVYMNYAKVMYEQLDKDPSTDVVGLSCMDRIYPNYYCDGWTGSNIDPRHTEFEQPYKFGFYDSLIAPLRLVMFSKRSLDFVLFNPLVKIYEDFVLLQKLIQLYREKEINITIVTSNDCYIYDTTGPSITRSVHSEIEWAKWKKLAYYHSRYNCHYSWGSTHDLNLSNNWETIQDKPTREQYMRDNLVSDIYVYAYGTDITKCKRLVDSAHHFGYNLTLEGVGSQYAGHQDKINNFRDFCLKRDPEDIVLFVDAYDVLFVRPEKDLYKLWKKVCPKGKVLFNAEKNIWPDQELIHMYPKVTTDFKFLNSGVYMGRAKDLLKILPEKGHILEKFDDQRYFANKYVLHKNKNIALDNYASCFLAMCYSIKEIGYTGKHIYQTTTKTKPCVLHANFSENLDYLDTLFDLLKFDETPHIAKIQDINFNTVEVDTINTDRLEK